MAKLNNTPGTISRLTSGAYQPGSNIIVKSPNVRGPFQMNIKNGENRFADTKENGVADSMNYNQAKSYGIHKTDEGTDDTEMEMLMAVMETLMTEILMPEKMRKMMVMVTDMKMLMMKKTGAMTKMSILTITIML